MNDRELFELTPAQRAAVNAEFERSIEGAPEDEKAELRALHARVMGMTWQERRDRMTADADAFVVEKR